MKTKHERRYKRYHIPIDGIFQLLLCEAYSPECSIPRIRFTDTIGNIEVVTVHYDALYLNFVFILYHESFPIVPESMIIPLMEPTLKIELFRFTNETKTEHLGTISASDWRKLPSMLGL